MQKLSPDIIEPIYIDIVVDDYLRTKPYSINNKFFCILHYQPMKIKADIGLIEFIIKHSNSNSKINIRTYDNSIDFTCDTKINKKYFKELTSITPILKDHKLYYRFIVTHYGYHIIIKKGLNCLLYAR